MSLELTFEDNIAVIKMDDGKVNALDNHWFETMLSMLDDVQASDAITLIILGRDKIYSGGLNVKWLPNMDKEETTRFSHLFPGTFDRLFKFPKPTIAAITGHAIAGGCLIACACDRRLAIRGPFNLAMNEVFIDMTIPKWAIDIVLDVIPKPQANDVLNLGEPLSVARAHELGVIRELYEDKDSMMKAAMDLARSTEAISLPDFAATKAQVRKPHN